MLMQKTKINILSFDIEDYFQVDNFRKTISFSQWSNFEVRVEKNTKRILNILEEYDTRATFFVLGWIAEKFPNLIKEIHQLGHEIASHGFDHQLVTSKDARTFREDIRKSKRLLEDIIQEPVYGYRAPTFSITKDSEWAFDILMEEGFKYDSSVFPFRYDKTGLPENKRYIHKIYNQQHYLWELPISNVKILGKNFPFSGGGYFRLFPYDFIKNIIQKHNNTNHIVIVYLHPWELDPKQPKIKAGFLNSFRHYVNIAKTENKLKNLLDDFEFGPIRENIEL
ncbi:MAG: DUF3473 domain-containing protein [Candidatus Omnitrophica bacterium]|nr:DUF3473 domain-containing protein [Candidatus Omnitrophota bacterium]